MAHTLRAPTASSGCGHPSVSARVSCLLSGGYACPIHLPPKCYDCQGFDTPAIPMCRPLIPRILQTVETTLGLHSREGGSTVSLIHGNMAGQRRYAVAVYPKRAINLVAQPSWQDLTGFILSNLHVLLKSGRALGTWFNRALGHHVLDVVVCPSDLQVALELGARFGQCSIFDLAAELEIKVDRRHHAQFRGQEAAQ